MSKEKVFFYIHGFGVEKTARGIFTDISNAFPLDLHVLFDLNEILEEGRVIKVRNLSEQIFDANLKLNEVIKNYLDHEIFIIAHSQGCAIASFLENVGLVKKIILITPPFSMDRKRTKNAFEGISGVDINFDGLSTLKRRDGTETFIESSYWGDREQYNVIQSYLELNKKTGVEIILANQDEVLKDRIPEELENKMKFNYIDGNHNFDGFYRSGLTSKITDILNIKKI
jgi:hypothetical protein